MLITVRQRLLPLLYRIHEMSWYQRYKVIRHKLLGPEITAAVAECLSNKYVHRHNRPATFSSLAIIVPCFGHEQYLRKMFESILNQTRKPDCVIFVDDCSSDNSSVLLRQFLAEGRQMGVDCYLLCNDVNRGQAWSINRAIESVDTNLVLVLNDDDYLFHDIVEVMFRLFARYPNACLIGATSVHVASNEAIINSPKSIACYAKYDEIELTIHNPEDVINYRNFNDINMTHTGCCFWRQAWEDIGGYQAVSTERVVPFSDRDFQLRMNAQYPIGICNAVPFSFWRTNSTVDRWINS